MVSPTFAMELVTNWECLPGFPKTDTGIQALASAFLKICPDDRQAEWLCQAVLDGCTHSPTPIEMRRIYCQKFPPADGREDHQVDQSDRMASRRY